MNTDNVIVNLKNYFRFSGGLNLNGADGEYSLYTTFNNREIMFHVSTLLPTSTDPDDRQQVDKKRHLGNDIVAVIFQDRFSSFLRRLQSLLS